ncbi:NUDIX hydrolase [Klugiella xanthotipulae]|uniref:8-oxo-dGTP diphosphatase n=1 Tax=Klugiella xanthotipulae TaxID=244735 RepID=A0A543HYH7_9MICO|nr:NUDIX domain-containing protein [Klugiella xanthotipulae]TQM63369.1 8-oxo-dGTP diphosphatase [Klugiella xanthotipulae]
MTDLVYASGAVCWRRVGDELMILLIHRTQHKDISFPKGKLDPGETLPMTAVREVEEETGLAVSLGANLGSIHYPLPKGREKFVQYWAAEVSEEAVQRSTFMPNKEVDALIWTPLKKVRAALDYQQDKEIFDVFLALVERQAHDTFSVVLLRHAQAEPRGEAFPVDHLRPLTGLGRGQSLTIAPTIAAFGRAKILSSTAVRCRQTSAPLATLTSKKVATTEDLSQDAWDEGTGNLRGVLGKVVRQRKNVVLCSHRPVLPDIARELVLATGTIPGGYLTESTDLPVSGFSVFHLSQEHPSSGILSIETYPKLLS